jgi:hypothetical protein
MQIYRGFGVPVKLAEGPDTVRRPIESASKFGNQSAPSDLTVIELGFRAPSPPWIFVLSEVDIEPLPG